MYPRDLWSRQCSCSPCDPLKPQSVYLRDAFEARFVICNGADALNAEVWAVAERSCLAQGPLYTATGLLAKQSSLLKGGTKKRTRPMTYLAMLQLPCTIVLANPRHWELFQTTLGPWTNLKLACSRADCKSQHNVLTLYDAQFHHPTASLRLNPS